MQIQYETSCINLHITPEIACYLTGKDKTNQNQVYCIARHIYSLVNIGTEITMILLPQERKRSKGVSSTPAFLFQS